MSEMNRLIIGEPWKGNSWSLMMLELLGQLIVKFLGIITIITIQQVEQVEQVPARLDLSLWIDPSKSTALNQLHHLTTQQLISWSMLIPFLVGRCWTMLDVRCSKLAHFLVTLATMLGSNLALLKTSESCACFLSAHRPPGGNPKGVDVRCKTTGFATSQFNTIYCYFNGKNGNRNEPDMFNHQIFVVHYFKTDPMHFKTNPNKPNTPNKQLAFDQWSVDNLLHFETRTGGNSPLPLNEKRKQPVPFVLLPPHPSCTNKYQIQLSLPCHQCYIKLLSFLPRKPLHLKWSLHMALFACGFPLYGQLC